MLVVVDVHRQGFYGSITRRACDACTTTALEIDRDVGSYDVRILYTATIAYNDYRIQSAAFTHNQDLEYEYIYQDMSARMMVATYIDTRELLAFIHLVGWSSAENNMNSAKYNYLSLCLAGGSAEFAEVLGSARKAGMKAAAEGLRIKKGIDGESQGRQRVCSGHDAMGSIDLALSEKRWKAARKGCGKES